MDESEAVALETHQRSQTSLVPDPYRFRFNDRLISKRLRLARVTGVAGRRKATSTSLLSGAINIIVIEKMAGKCHRLAWFTSS